MKKREALDKYKEAGRLYRARQYEECLHLLETIDRAFPGEANVVYARAMVLSKIERFYEARLLANRLEREFDDPRTKSLRERINRRQRRARRRHRDEQSPDDIEVDDWGF